MDRKLPLTKNQGSGASLDPASEAEIARVVDAFYRHAMADPVLGPVFEARVEDWDEHLATMRDFWSSAIHRTGRYSGRPLEAHRRIGELAPEHFDRWIDLWERTVRETARPETQGPMIEIARRMARVMSTRLGVAGIDG